MPFKNIAKQSHHSSLAFVHKRAVALRLYPQIPSGQYHIFVPASGERIRKMCIENWGKQTTKQKLKSLKNTGRIHCLKKFPIFAKAHMFLMKTLKIENANFKVERETTVCKDVLPILTTFHIRSCLRSLTCQFIWIRVTRKTFHFRLHGRTQAPVCGHRHRTQTH